MSESSEKIGQPDPAAVSAARERLHQFESQFHVHPKHPDWGMVISPAEVDALRTVLAALAARDEASEAMRALEEMLPDVYSEGHLAPDVTLSCWGGFAHAKFYQRHATYEKGKTIATAILTLKERVRG